MSYAIKLGDTTPPLEFLCVGPDGSAVDLTGVEAVTFAVRRAGELDPAILKTLDDGVTISTPATQGKLSIAWAVGDTDTMREGPMEFEAQVVRGPDDITTFPGSGYGTFDVWRDIAPEPGEGS